MKDQEKAAIQAWADRWTCIAPRLRELDNERDFGTPLAELIPQFNDALRSAFALHPAVPYSGLIDQQQYFRRLRE